MKLLSKILARGKLLFIISFVLIMTLNWVAYLLAMDNETISNEKVNGCEIYLNARKMFFSSSGSIHTIINLIKKAQKNFERLPEGFEKYYWQGMNAFLMAEVTETTGDKREAARKFMISSELAQKALLYRNQFSDANRLVADTYQRLMNYNGKKYAMSKASEVLKLLNTAITLDAKNYQAYISLGTYYLYSPAIAGGSVNKAIAMFSKALESKEEFDCFQANVWLGKAYTKKKDVTTAKTCFQKALQIYPNSIWAKKSLEDITSSNK